MKKIVLTNKEADFLFKLLSNERKRLLKLKSESKSFDRKTCDSLLRRIENRESNSYYISIFENGAIRHSVFFGSTDEEAAIYCEQIEANLKPPFKVSFRKI